ncbi:MAG: hypothetical protein AVDCRST_MAG10-3656, partial [uncultured Acidimicrobiales bacterium]
WKQASPSCSCSSSSPPPCSGSGPSWTSFAGQVRACSEGASCCGHWSSP